MQIYLDNGFLFQIRVRRSGRLQRGRYEFFRSFKMSQLLSYQCRICTQYTCMHFRVRLCRNAIILVFPAFACTKYVFALELSFVRASVRRRVNSADRNLFAEKRMQTKFIAGNV